MAFKVVTAVSTEPVLLAEARLQIKAEQRTSEDTLITAWITAARELAEQYTGRALAPVALEAALDCFPGYENDYIDLPTCRRCRRSAASSTRTPRASNRRSRRAPIP
jgi:hypothetical protein